MSRSPHALCPPPRSSPPPPGSRPCPLALCAFASASASACPMKSFRRLSNLVLNTHKSPRDKDKPDRERRSDGGDGLPGAQDAEGLTIARGMQELRDMTARYQGLVTVSAQLAACAYEFSGAVQDMGSYCVNNFGFVGNDDIGKIFETVGKVQFEISKFLDLYGSHVSQTLVTPTESLLAELRRLEDSKRQYDAKRQAYDTLRYNSMSGRMRSSKEDALLEKQMQQNKVEREELAVFIGCRLLSLQHGRPRSLITQAARHYTAQVQLFSSVLEALQGIEGYMKNVMQERDIDENLNSAADAASDKQSVKVPEKNNSKPNTPSTKAVPDQSPVEQIWANMRRTNNAMTSASPLGYQKVYVCDPMVVSPPPSPRQELGTSVTLGPPSRRPPTPPIPPVQVDEVQDVEHLDLTLIEEARGSSDNQEQSDEAAVAEEASALSHERVQVQQEASGARPTATSASPRTSHVPPTVTLAIPTLSSAAISNEQSHNKYRRPDSIPEASPVRRHSQSGPLARDGTPWSVPVSRASSSLNRLPRDHSIFGTPRSSKVAKVQISELHKLPAPPSSAPATSGTGHAGGGRGTARSGPLFKSHDDLASRTRTTARQQLLAAEAAYGRSGVSRSLSLPASAPKVQSSTPPNVHDSLRATRKPSRIEKKERTVSVGGA